MLTFLRRPAAHGDEPSPPEMVRKIRLVVAENSPMDVILSTHSS